MMGLFSYVYYSSLIRVRTVHSGRTEEAYSGTQIHYVTAGSIMQTVVTSLTTTEQLELFADLKRFLEGQGVRPR